jgi:hypothetical protein
MTLKKLTRPIAVMLIAGVMSTLAFAQGNIEACQRNLSPEIYMINSIYDLYNNEGIESVEGTEGVWWARWSLEKLRWAISGGEGGNTSSGTTMCNKKAKETDEWKVLNEQLTELETKVVEVETAKGIEFVGLQNDDGETMTDGSGRTVYKDTQSGEVYSAGDSQYF